MYRYLAGFLSIQNFSALCVNRSLALFPCQRSGLLYSSSAMKTASGQILQLVYGSTWVLRASSTSELMVLLDSFPFQTEIYFNFHKLPLSSLLTAMSTKCCQFLCLEKSSTVHLENSVCFKVIPWGHIRFCCCAQSCHGDTNLPLFSCFLTRFKPSTQVEVNVS